MATPINIPPIVKGQPLGLRNTEKANELILAINQLRSATVRISDAPSSVSASESGVVITISGEEIAAYLRSKGYI